MGDACRNLLRFYLLNRSSSCNSYLYLFTLDCLASKKSGQNGLQLVVIYFLILWIATEVISFRVTRRFDTTLDKFEILTQTYQLGFI